MVAEGIGSKTGNPVPTDTGLTVGNFLDKAPKGRESTKELGMGAPPRTRALRTPRVPGSGTGTTTQNCAKGADRNCQDPIFPGFSPDPLFSVEKTLTPQWRASDPGGSCHGIGTSEASAAAGGDRAPRARPGGPSPCPGSPDPGSCRSGTAGNPGRTSCGPSGPKAVERGKTGDMIPTRLRCSSQRERGGSEVHFTGARSHSSHGSREKKSGKKA